jgi:hypothetical protein
METRIMNAATSLLLCLAAFATDRVARAQQTYTDTIIHYEPVTGSFPHFAGRLELGEANGDGVLDLFIADLGGPKKALILLGPGFTQRIDIAVPPFDGPWGIVGFDIGDVNGDLVDDVFIGAAGATASGETYAGRAFVVFGPTYQQSFEVVRNGSPGNFEMFGSSFAHADFDHDGQRDLFVGAAGAAVNHIAEVGRIDVYRGASPFVGALIASLVPAFPQTNASYGRSMLIHDIDHDGHDDLLTTNRKTAIEVGFTWLSNLNPAVASSMFIPSSGADLGWGVRTAACDADGDGGVDVVASDYSFSGGGRIHVFRGPAFGPPQYLSAPGQSSNAETGRALDVGDVNRDGYGDIVVGGPTDDFGTATDCGRLTIFFGPTFATTQSFLGHFKNTHFGEGVLLHDFDDDGFPELLVGAGGEWGGGTIHLMKHEPLAIDGASTVSLSAGGSVQFRLQRGALSGSAPYLLLLSASGSNPGLNIPFAGGSVHLPLNFDVATQFGIQFASSPVFANFQGVLDATGSANPQLVVPAGSSDPSLIGLTLTFAALLGESGPYVDHATNAVTVVLGG